MNLLFICSRNQWRSPTAEKIFNDQFHNAGSAGTASSAKIKITEKLINWADLIFVMEKKHKQQIIEKFSDVLKDKELIVLDIPDEYRYMDEELIQTLMFSVSPYLSTK